MVVFEDASADVLVVRLVKLSVVCDNVATVGTVSLADNKDSVVTELVGLVDCGSAAEFVRNSPDSVMFCNTTDDVTNTDWVV